MTNEFDPNWSSVKRDLWELLKCPTDWEKVCPETELCFWLRFAWYLQIKDHEVDRESSLLDPDEIEPSDMWFALLAENEARSTLVNAKSWHRQASENYKLFTRKLWRLAIATSSDYEKHYAPPGSRDPDVADLSNRRGESILYPRLTPTVQIALAWRALSEYVFESMTSEKSRSEFFHSPDDARKILSNIFGGHQLTIHARLYKPVGCTNGIPTKFICIDFDLSTPLAHMYPESEQEFNAAQRQVFVSFIDRQ